MSETQFLIRDYMRDNVPMAEGRVFSVKSPEDIARPYIVIHRIGDPRRTMGSRQLRLQFSCFADTYGPCRETADQVREAIRQLGQDDSNDIYASYEESDMEFYDQKSQLYHIAVDGIFYFQDISWG